MIDVPVPVKEALRDGRLKKNYRFVVLHDDGTEDFTIDNDNLVSESVNIDERMCSGDIIKFGLCEGASLEFQYFEKANITGRRVKAFVDVEYKESPYEEVGTIDEAAPYPGYRYDVTTAGDYLIYFGPDQRNKAYGAMKAHSGVSTWYTITWFDNNHGEVNIPDVEAGDTLYLGSNPRQYAKATVYLEVENTYTIPLGFFTVKKCSRQASTGIIKATAYNKLQSKYLDAKANEYVTELVEQGEYGYTDKISLYTLLKDLLQGYGIEKSSYNYIVPQLSDYQSSNITAIRICDSSGNNTNYYVYLYMIEVGVDLDHEEFYKFEAYTSSLKAHAKEYVWENYKTYTTKIGNTVYTLEELANTAYSDSYDLCGEISLRKHVDINTYFFTRKGGRTNLYTGDYSECHQLCVSIPVHVTVSTSQPYINPTLWRSYFEETWGSDYQFFKIQQKDLSSAEKIRITKAEAEAFGDVTLRDLQSAVFETQCQFGQLSRITDLFSGVELNHSRLYPAEDLYPATDLYPGGAAVSATKSMYSKLWADEGNIHKWRYLIITYKGLDGNGNEADFTLQRTVNSDGTDNYNMSDNWLFRNLIWTAADVGDYADAMVAKMSDITWFPFEMWLAGLPYMETGDEIEISLGEDTYTSYILQRQLQGIQNLQDTYINGTLDIT